MTLSGKPSPSGQISKQASPGVGMQSPGQPIGAKPNTTVAAAGSQIAGRSATQGGAEGNVKQPAGQIVKKGGVS